MLNKLCILLVLLLFNISIALSAPSNISVSGTVSSGQSITISGTGFLTKTTAAPVLWDTVDNQSAYSALANGDSIPTGAGNPWEASVGTVFNSTEGRSSSEGYKSNGAIAVSTLEGVSVGTSPPHIYVSWWWRPSVSPMTNNESHSSKFIRLSRAANLTNQTHSWTQNQNIVFDNPNYVANNWDSYPGTANQWNFHEVWFDNVNKTYTLRVNGQTLRNNASWSAGTFNFDYLWKLGWDSGGTSPLSMTTWTDDIYIDSSFARVMLCNEASYAQSTHCEMQVPSAWSNTEISATVNPGTFAADSTAYLYVVDSTGAVNTLGYAVEIGASGGVADTAPPVLSLLAPSGTLAAGTTSTTISHVTNEAATCRYSATPGTDYADMTLSFDSSYAMSHSATVSGLTNGGSYNRYARCIDGAGNANTTDAVFSFSVASSAGTAGVLSWQYSTYSAERSDVRIPINIVRTGGSTGTVTAQWSSNGQTATHDVDYYGNDNVTVTFADGVTSIPINTYGVGDNGIEMIANGADNDRYFQMILTNPTGGATLGTALATVTIKGDYIEPSPPNFTGSTTGTIR